MDRNVPFDVIRPAIDVALRKESVDRNGRSLPVFLLRGVALRKESVDRNQQCGDGRQSVAGRSPQGERG